MCFYRRVLRCRTVHEGDDIVGKFKSIPSGCMYLRICFNLNDVKMLTNLLPVVVVVDVYKQDKIPLLTLSVCTYIMFGFKLLKAN